MAHVFRSYDRDLIESSEKLALSKYYGFVNKSMVITSFCNLSKKNHRFRSMNKKNTNRRPKKN